MDWVQIVGVGANSLERCLKDGPIYENTHLWSDLPAWKTWCCPRPVQVERELTVLSPASLTALTPLPSKLHQGWVSNQGSKHLKGLQQAQITVAVKQQHTSETKVQFQVPRFWSCSIFWSLEEAGLRSCLDDGRRNTEHGLLRWRWRSGHYSARAAPRPGNHLF